ncbi:MAG: GntR family transcriptional regulator [Alteromonas sp.]|nr:GntR family transcriptional regulator [Alteromonas sp.]|tara:strand:+ start:12862 stop:13554 length:693 start_codon:yes stop_codon:yes gene_type:complete
MASQSSTPKVSSALAIYEKIREEILSLTMSPGAMIDEISIAKRFDVSRSPVREAFIRLASDGLIKTLPNKNSQVAPLEIEDFPRYIDALDLVQRAVTRLAAIHHTAEDLAEIKNRNDLFKQAVETRDPLNMIDTNFEFHLAVSQASHNKYFTHMYTRLLNEGRRTLRIYYRSFNDNPPPQMVGTHDDIIEAIEKRDAEVADQLAHDHTIQLSDGFINYLSKHFTTDMKFY